MKTTGKGVEGVSRKIAGALAESFVFAKGRRLWEANSKDWNYPLSKMEKLLAGSYLILADYSKGLFPPKFDDRAQAYAGEINYRNALPGLPQNVPVDPTKPFSSARWARTYMKEYLEMLDVLDKYGIHRGQRILELGCGCGWMCELLALGGYNVVGTTIAPDDIEVGLKRIKSLECKGVASSVEFEIAAMETIDRIKTLREGFDCVIIFEALHHAFDWRETLASTYKVVKPGGWFLIANEPKPLHTFISYRVAKLSNTHEVGMSRRAIAQHLKKVGFARVDLLKLKFYDLRTGIWIIAQKPK